MTAAVRARAARGVRTLAAAALVLGALLGPASAPARAAGATFEDPAAAATWPDGIDVSVVVTLDRPAAGAELRVAVPGTPGTWAEEVEPPGAGRSVLRHRLDLAGDAHLVPNTPLELSWHLVLDDGSAVRSAAIRVTWADTSLAWRTLEGDLLRLHWHTGSEAFARRALAIGEAAVADTAALLGVTEREPIDFFVYGDPAAFRSALGPGTRENVGGQAHAEIRTLFALIDPSRIDDPWVAVVVPHELVHLVFDTAVENPFRYPPRWLNEGLATWLSEGGLSAERRALVAAAIRAGRLVPLDGLTGRFPVDPDAGYLAYGTAASAIDHLVARHGRDAMVDLVRAYRDGRTDDEAFRIATGGGFAAFQADWLASLGAPAPERYGPRAAPAGPVPAAWAAGAATPGPGATTVPAVPADPAGEGGPAVVAGSVLAVAIGGIIVGMVLFRRRATRP